MSTFVNRRTALTNTMAAITAVVFSPVSVWPKNSHAQVPAEHIVEIKDFGYHPKSLTIRLGDTVTWTNRDIAPHTATATDKSWDTGTIKRNDTFKIKVTHDHSGEYFCRHHPAMKAELILASAH